MLEKYVVVEHQELRDAEYNEAEAVRDLIAQSQENLEDQMQHEISQAASPVRNATSQARRPKNLLSGGGTLNLLQAQSFLRPFSSRSCHV